MIRNIGIGRGAAGAAAAVALTLSLWLPHAAGAAAETTSATDGATQGEDATDVRTMQTQLRALQAEVKELRQAVACTRAAAPPATQPAAANAEPVPFDRALDDADRHARMLDSTGLTAGWAEHPGFFIRSEDGNFLLSPFSLFQARYAAAYRNHASASGGDDTQAGFEIRRLQLGVDGHLFTPDLTYRIFWQSSELTSGNLSLLMAWVQYRFHDTPWVVGGGQFKAPFAHEQLVSDAAQLAADRTFVDDQLAGGEAFSKGVTLRFDDGRPFRAEAAVTNGFNVNNTSFQQFPTNAANFGVAARGEHKFFGDWADYNQFSSQGSHADLLVVGAGADYTEAGHTDVLRHTIDLQWNPGPIGFYAAYLGRYTRGNTAGRHGDTYDPAAIAQVSWLFAPGWEAFGRYDYLHLDGREFTAGTKSTVHEITVGGTYYFRGQRAKLTLDLSYLPNGAPLADLGNDILANPGHAEVIGRAQFQLLL